ncbi:MAG TPA: hypothetical protein PLQ67_10475 [Burkholderiaceae bacterium]|nr:hypothetical protein [Burkholderiaceae bacterium]
MNAGAQGINLAAGFQDRFDVKPMIAMGGIAAFGAVMGTVTSTLDKAFQGTLLGAEVPGSAATRTLLASSNPLTEEISMAWVTQPAVPAIKAGALDWLGTAISWGTGATAGSLARQGLMMATGQQNGIAWDRIHLDAVKQAIGGFLRIHVGSSFASNPFTFTHYRPMGLGDMAIDVAKRVAGTFATNLVLKNVGMLDDIRLSDLLAVGAARAAQVLLRDAMGTLPIAGNATPSAFVSSALGQSIIRTTTVLTNAAVQAAYGQSIDWNNLLYLGVGRVAGQFGTLWGTGQVQGALESMRSHTRPAAVHTQSPQ